MDREIIKCWLKSLKKVDDRDGICWVEQVTFHFDFKLLFAPLDFRFFLGSHVAATVTEFEVAEVNGLSVIRHCWLEYVIFREVFQFI